MAGDEKKKMTIWITPKDREDLDLIVESVGLASLSSAIRYAIRRVARMTRADDRRRATPHGPAGEGGTGG